MIKVVIRSALGLLVGVVTLAAARPASATVWKSKANEFYCMGSSGSNMTPGTNIILYQCDEYADQSWGQVSFDQGGTYQQLYSFAAPTPVNTQSRCAGVAAGSISNGAGLTLWNCNTPAISPDQGWEPVYTGQDSTGHNCYYFINENAQNSGDTRVIQVGGSVTNGTRLTIGDYNGQTYQLWCAFPDPTFG